MKLYLAEEDVLAMLPMSKAIELLDTAFHQLTPTVQQSGITPAVA